MCVGHTSVMFLIGEANRILVGQMLPSPWIKPGLLIEFDGSMCVLLAG